MKLSDVNHVRILCHLLHFSHPTKLFWRRGVGGGAVHPFLLTSTQEHNALPFVRRQLAFATVLCSQCAPSDACGFDSRLPKVRLHFSCPFRLCSSAHVDITVSNDIPFSSCGVEFDTCVFLKIKNIHLSLLFSSR